LSTGADSRWAAIKAPSGIDTAAEQTGDAPLLQNWRPAPNSGLPPALASPIFGRIADAVFSTVDPREEDMNAAFELCDIASSYLEYEVSSRQLLLLLGSAYHVCWVRTSYAAKCASHVSACTRHAERPGDLAAWVPANPPGPAHLLGEPAPQEPHGYRWLHHRQAAA
jgi:hypothetical protein